MVTVCFLAEILLKDIPNWVFSLIVLVGTGLSAAVAAWIWKKADERYVKKEDYEKAMHDNQLQHGELKHRTVSQIKEVEESLTHKVMVVETSLTVKIDDLKKQSNAHNQQTQQSLDGIRIDMNKNQLSLVATVSEMKGELKGMLESRS